MMKFEGILKKREPWKNVMIVATACFMIAIALMGKQYTYAALSFVVILAVFFKKEHIISEEGVDIQYNLFGLKHVNRWTWDEISAVKTDYKKAAPDVMLHIGKDVTIRAFVMKRSDIPKILKLAESKNPNIFIGDSDHHGRNK